MEKLHASALLRCNIGTQKGNLLLLLLAAVFLTSLLVSSTGSAATLRSSHPSRLSHLSRL